MGRTSGYRAKKADKEVVQGLRDALSRTPAYEWQHAQRLMNEIIDALGKPRGPMGGRIVPRACKVCHYFGHTKQWCPVLAKQEERKAIAEVKAEREWMRKQRARDPHAERHRNAGKHQGTLYDEIGVPWTMHPAGIGPFPCSYLGVEGGMGKWVRGADGTVKMALE